MTLAPRAIVAPGYVEGRLHASGEVLDGRDRACYRVEGNRVHTVRHRGGRADQPFLLLLLLTLLLRPGGLPGADLSQSKNYIK